MQRRLKRAFLFLAVLWLAASCGDFPGKRSREDLTGQVSVSGAFALYPLALEWENEFERLHPGVRVDVSAGGAGKGMTDILNGMTDFAMLSRELHEEEIQRGALAFTVGRDAVIPVINAHNPFLEALQRRGITAEDARRIWVTREITTWGQLLGTADRTPIRVYTRSDACGAAQTFAAWFDARQDELSGTAVFGDPGIATAVRDDRFGIGFNNLAYAYDPETGLPQSGLTAFPIDQDDDGSIREDEDIYATKERLVKAIEAGDFPSPPARNLYLVAKGTPSDAAAAFLRYIIKDGQRLNAPNGYVRISESAVHEAQRQLRQARKGNRHLREDNTAAIVGVILGLLLFMGVLSGGSVFSKTLSGKRMYKERVSAAAMTFFTVSSLLVLAGILVLLVGKSLPLLQQQSLKEVLTGHEWIPSQGKFGFAPFIGGTVMVTLCSLCLCVPISLFTAVFLTEYAPRGIRKIVYPALDILAALPSVIYGVWGVLFLIPRLGYSLASGSLVLSVMILPLLISLFTELFAAVPQELREASLAIGATPWQTTRNIVLRKTLPGIFASVVLALSKCMGETIAVMMVCGSVARIPLRLSDGFYTLPALIGNNYGEMASVPLYESAIMFAALILTVIVLLFNVLSRVILYRIQKNM